MLVIGDGCTDDSAAVVASFDDARVRWHNMPENSGSQSAPNNAGTALARGRYIAYLGHDDIWLPSHLGALVGALRENNADVAYTLIALIGPEETDFHAIAGLSVSGGYEYDLPVPPSSTMHVRELAEQIGGWNDYRTIVDPPDRDFFNRAFAANKRFIAIPRLTAVKFPSAWRKNSYRERRNDQQAEYSQRLCTDPDFLTDELLAIIATYVLERQLPVPKPAVPNEVPPGWYVQQWRRERGLDPDEASPSSPSTSEATTDAGGPHVGWSAQDFRPERYMRSLERTLSERDGQFAEVERYTRSLEAHLATVEQARHDAEGELAVLRPYAAEREQRFAEAAQYAHSVEHDLTRLREELQSAQQYAQSLEGALDAKGEALFDAAGYTRFLESALSARDATVHKAAEYTRSLENELHAKSEALCDATGYARSLEDNVNATDAASHDAAVYARALENELRAMHATLHDAAAYTRLLERELNAKDDALCEVARYTRSLEDALNARDVALRDAAQYVALLEAVGTRSDYVREADMYTERNGTEGDG